MTDMKKIRPRGTLTADAWRALRSNDKNATVGIREFSCTMDGRAPRRPTRSGMPSTPAAKPPAASGMSTRRSSIPAGTERAGTPRPSTARNATSKAHKYVTGGYFAVASDYHRSIGLNSGRGDFIGNYFLNGKIDAGYFRLQSSEDMVLENLAKYYARYARSPFVQDPTVSKTEGVMVGGAKIIWSDSVTDGRMRDMEVARVSGAVDGARLPKEVFYGLQVAQNTRPASPCRRPLELPGGNGEAGLRGRQHGKSEAPDARSVGEGDQGLRLRPQRFRSARTRPGEPLLLSLRERGVAARHHQGHRLRCTGKGPLPLRRNSPRALPRRFKLTPILGPSGKFYADGSDVAVFDVEVVDAGGNRCPTYEDRVDFTCSGEGVFLGGYNSGIRYSTNAQHLTTGYHLNFECGINRVFVRATRRAGEFTLNVSRPGLSPASRTIASDSGRRRRRADDTGAAVLQRRTGPRTGPDEGGRFYHCRRDTERRDRHRHAKEQSDRACRRGWRLRVDRRFRLLGAHIPVRKWRIMRKGAKVYKDSDVTFGTLPAALAGADYIQPYQSDAGETSSTDQYQFNLLRASYVYLLIDSVNEMPASNDNEGYKWQKQPGTVEINGRRMDLYKSRLMQPKDNVYLATNGHGIKRFDLKSNMYLVFVVPAK